MLQATSGTTSNHCRKSIVAISRRCLFQTATTVDSPSPSSNSSLTVPSPSLSSPSSSMPPAHSAITRVTVLPQIRWNLNRNYTTTTIRNINLHLQMQSSHCQQQRFASYAAVDHSSAYEEAMEGRHGKQLDLALKEGEGKDDPHYDPFKAYAVDEEYDDDGEEDDEEDDEEDGNEEEDSLEEDDGDADDDEDDGEVPVSTKEILSALETEVKYNKDGSRIRPKSQLAAFQAGLPSGGIFAVINLNGSQQKVTKDDVVIVNKLKPVDKWAVGSTHTLTEEDVLLVGSSHLTCVGMPGVSGAEVDVMVEEITRDQTVLVFKKRRRKHSRRKNGFRREVTFLRVLDIRFPETYRSVDFVQEK